MASQTVSIVLSAKDFASGVLSKVGASLGALTKQSGSGGMGAALSGAFSAAQKESEGLIDSMTLSVLKANAIGQAFNLVGGAIMTARQELEKMSSIQLESLGSANSLAQVGKISLTESQGMLDSMQKDLAQKAAMWAGETSQYLQVLRMVQPDIARGSKINGKLMKEDFRQNALDISGDYTAIGVASGSGPQETGLFLKRLLNGASMAELNNLSFGMNNPIVTQNITKEMMKMGVASMEQLSQAQRLAIIKAAGKAGNSEEMQKAASGTIDGLLQGFRSKIFDPHSGYLGGVFRKLDGVPGQSATVAEAFNKALAKLIGEDGLFNTITKTLSAIGLGGFDPMVSLRNSLDSFSGFIVGVNATFQGINTQLASGAKVSDLIGGAIADFTSKVSNSFSGIGERAATEVNSFVDGLLKNASGVDYGSIVQAIGRGLGTLFAEIGSFLSNLDPQVYLVGAGVLIASAIGMVVVAAVGGLVVTIGAAIVGLGAPVLLAIAGVGLAAIGLFKMYGDQIGTFGSQAGQTIGQFSQSAMSAIGSFLSETGQFFVGLIALTMPGLYIIGALVNSQLSGATTAIQANGSAIQGWFSELFRSFSEMIGGTIGVVSDLGKKAFDLVGQLISEIGKFLSSAIAFVKANPVKQGLDWGGQKLDEAGKMLFGQVPAGHYLGGFLGAIDREARNSDGVPVIANSTEAILTPGQLQSMVAGVYASGQNSSRRTVHFSPTFHVEARGDAEETARATLQIFEEWLSQANASFMGA